MNSSEFSLLLNERIRKKRSILDVKAGEYASEQDRLHNFKKVASFASVSPAKACLVLMGKHLVSIADLVQRSDEGQSIQPDVLDEKLGDASNYLDLLEAILKEKQ